MTEAPETPEPERREILDRPYAILVTGVGGTGVVTIGAILGMAAHLEGKGCGILDMAGLAQKGGAVFTHVKLAERPEDINAIRVAAGEADLVLGCDLVAAGNRKVLGAMRKGDTGIVVNTAALFPGEFARDAAYDLPTARLKKLLRETAGEHARFVDATRAATALLGTSLAANMFMLGYAWQAGLVPLSELSILRAITLNAEAVTMNREAFALGRRASAYPDEVEGMVDAMKPRRKAPARSLDEMVARRAAFLTEYQDKAYAERYRALVETARSAEKVFGAADTSLSEAVAKGFHKLLAVKDEYEVARLYSDGAFARQIAETFEGDLAVTYHMAPPVFTRRNKDGVAIKTKFGPWFAKLFPLLAKGKRLRGTKLDLFGYAPERRMERKLAADYENLMNTIFAGLTPENHAIAVALAALPETIRGFGHVKEKARLAANSEQERLLALWTAGAPALRLAAE
jgi:indolepyruvate ferredoxin oxidoreductase